MTKIKLSMDYTHQWINHPLLILLYIDDRIIHIDNSGAKQNKIIKNVACSGSNHQFQMEIRNKNNDNVIVDANGHVEEDSYVKINSFCFNNFEMADRIATQDLSTFYIDNSHHTLRKTLTFAHNGILRFDFKVPLYSWILRTWL